MPAGIYQRGGWWWARAQVAGVDYRDSLRIAVGGPKEERAARAAREKWRQEIIDEVRRGVIAPVRWPAAVLAWHAAATANRLRPATIKRYTTSLKQLRPHLDTLAVKDVDAATIRAIIAARRTAGASNATLRRDLTALSAVIGHAIAEGWRREGDNPALALDRRQRLPERRDPIALPLPAEVAALIAAAPPRFGDLIAFAHATGMRQEEVAALEHDRVDRQRMVAMVYRAKARRPRAVPLSAQALAIIDRQPQFIGQPWVFWHELPPKPEEEAALARLPEAEREAERIARRRERIVRYSNVASNFGRLRAIVAKRWAKANRRWQGFRFHDLRHDFAVRFLREGQGGIYDLQQVLGHSSIKVTELYLDFLTPEEKANAERGSAQKPAHSAPKRK